jgi:hypothetical protein
MSLFDTRHQPLGPRVTSRLSTERPGGRTPSALDPVELRGHVVLVNFWTLACINWLRQEPYVRAC